MVSVRHRSDKNCRLQDHVPLECTACPHDYVATGPRECTLRGHPDTILTGVHCGQDTGLGSMWEANLRMPTTIRWPGMIRPQSTNALVASIDIVPTILDIVHNHTEQKVKVNLDGSSITSLLFGDVHEYDGANRVLFLWRDGFKLDHSPLGPPYGRFDVVAAKIGDIKLWYWTKSGHYNDDVEQHHDPPLLFNTILDPAESKPIVYNASNPDDPHTQLVAQVDILLQEHKEAMKGTYPLTLQRDTRNIPCVDPSTSCRTDESESSPFSES